MELLQELNEKQQQAVSHRTGAFLVVAGPGTGKTKVITHRIAHLIRNHQVSPDQILAVTFTNKAKQEMLKHTEDLLGETQALDVRIHTFHAFCVRLLREHAQEIGLSKHFAIFDQETQHEVLLESLHELGLNQLAYPPQWLCDIISTYKVKLEDPTADRDEIRLGDGTVIDEPAELEAIADLFKMYQTKLAIHNALDFDDLIFRSVKMLEQVPEVRRKYHNDLQFILVDEYQDINAAQYTLLKLLSHKHNVMVVADEDQSIYSWRGSSSTYIEQFKEDFNPAVVELEEHYRCSEKILRAAGSVIAKNPRQKESVLKTHKDAGTPLHHYMLDTPDTEADLIITVIRSLVEGHHCSYGHIAILYRRHQLVEKLVDRLRQEEIQFQRAGQINSFQEEHAQGILSYLNFLQWELPRDIEKAVNFPEQLIDDLTLVRLKWLAQQKDITLVELLRKIDEYPDDVGPLTRWNVRQFFEQIDEFHEQIKGEQVHTIANKLFDLLSQRLSPYQSEDMDEIENRPEIAGLRAATDTLYSTIDRGGSIHLMASYGIDSYCAAYIVKITLERYLGLSIYMDLLPAESTVPPAIDGSGISILIGDFGELPERKETTILIGSAVSTDANVLRLSESELSQSHSVTVLKLCQRLLSSFENPNFGDMIVYDLETTSEDAERGQIIELGAIRLSATGSELEVRHQLVKPPGRIPQSSTHIHGINNEMVAGKPSIEAVLPRFLDFIKDHILIGHNIADFDNHVLERNLRFLNCGLSNPYYDTLATAQRLYPRETCSLEALADKFNIKYGTRHRAIEDARVTHRVFEKLIEEDLRCREMRSLPELLPLVGIGLLAAQGAQQDSGIHKEEDFKIKTYRDAAARYIRIHRPDLDGLDDNLQPTEKQLVQEFINTLTQPQLEDTPGDRDWEARRARFMNGVLHFESTSIDRDLTDFLDYQKLINNADEIEVETDKVTLMTLHTAKGTEFPVVIIMGLEDDMLPIWLSSKSQEAVEEERRLFYVGMTRAQARLYLTSVRYRRTGSEREGSRFLRDIPSDLVEHWHPNKKKKK